MAIMVTYVISKPGLEAYEVYEFVSVDIYKIGGWDFHWDFADSIDQVEKN